MMNTRTKKTIHQCFNPYFNGSSTSTMGKMQKLKHKTNVSILILMDLVLLLNTAARKNALRNMFQSLF